MNPWEEFPEIWKTQSAFFTWLRGGLRRAIWEKYPPKLVYKNTNCTPPPDWYEGRAKSGTECALSGEWIAKSYLEVDHIEGNVSLQEWEDVLPFIRHLCASHSNMQLVGKEAHKIKSYAERMGMTYEHAKIEKDAIKIIKDKQHKEFFISRNLKVPLMKNVRHEIVEILKNETIYN